MGAARGGQAETEFIGQSDVCRRAVIADMRERGLLPEKGI
jgi:hypothetical protein